MINTPKTFALTVIVLALVLTTHSIIKAAGGEIMACVNNKSGAVRIVNFTGGACRSGETAIVWNKEGIQGPKGDKGDTGEQGSVGPQGDTGLPAQHGAGNIAFIAGTSLLRTDGTVWSLTTDNGRRFYLQNSTGGGVTSVPIPVNDIVNWQYTSLVDRDGNYWFIEPGNIPAGWHNFGPLP